MTMEILGTKVSSVFAHDYMNTGKMNGSESVRTLFVSPNSPIIIQGVEYFGKIDIHYSVDNGEVSVVDSYIDLDSITRSTGRAVKNRRASDGLNYCTMTEFAYDRIKNGGDVDRIANDGIRYVKSWITRQENAAKREAREYLATAVATAPDTIREQVKALAGL